MSLVAVGEGGGVGRYGGRHCRAEGSALPAAAGFQAAQSALTRPESARRRRSIRSARRKHNASEVFQRSLGMSAIILHFAGIFRL